MIKKTIVGSIVLIWFLWTVPVKGESNPYKILIIHPKTEADNSYIVEKVDKYMIDFWTHPSPKLTAVTAMVRMDKVKPYIDGLKQKKIRYELKETDSMFALIEKQLKRKTTSRVGEKFDYEKFNTLEDIYAEMDRLKRDHPNRVIELKSIGKTFEKRDIKVMEISGNELKEKIVVFECGIHAREWLTQAFCMWSVNTLLANHRLLNDYDFIIIPVLNPDGYAYSWTYGNLTEIQISEMNKKDKYQYKDKRFWRKNREPMICPGMDCTNKLREKQWQSMWLPTGLCAGIDLNRNFETKGFCTAGGTGKNPTPPPIDPCDAPYCGQIAFRANECKALRVYLTPIRSKIVAYFAFHTFSQAWMYPYASSPEPAPNAQYLKQLSEKAVKAIAAVHGTVYQYGTPCDIMYCATGGSDEWAYDALGVKVSFTVEMRPLPISEKEAEANLYKGNLGFIQPDEVIKPNSEEVFAGVEAVLDQLTIDSKDAPGVEGPAQHLSGSYQVMASVVTILVVLFSAYILRFI